VGNRQREILFRYGLAEKFTSPSTSMQPRLEWTELVALMDSGHLLRTATGRIRLTAIGLAEVRGELALALGKDIAFVADGEGARG